MPNIFPADGNAGINTTAPKKALEVQYGAGRFDQLANPANLTYTITGPTGSTVYTYAVLAKDSNGNRTLAPTIVVNDGPTTLSPTNHITINWGPVTHAVKYDVLKLVSNAWMLLLPGNTHATSLSDTGGPTAAYTLPTHNETGHVQVSAFTATDDAGRTLPLAMPYLDRPGRHLAGVNHQTSLFQPLGSIDIGARIDSKTTGGGSWDDPSGSYTGYAAVWANLVSGARGTNGVYYAYAKGLGAGDVLPFGAIVDAWGGNGNQYSSGPEAAACGEFDLAQGSHVDGRNIFQATVKAISASGNELTYVPIANEDALGARYLLNRTRPRTIIGNVTGISIDATMKQTTVTFSGVSFSPSDKGKYLKIGSTDDLYAPPLKGDDVLMDGFCVGHWYRVIGVPANNTLLLAGLYDLAAFTMPNPTASYILMEGAEIQAFDQNPKQPTITLQDSRNWAIGDLIYSPPHHLMALTGINIIINKKFKTSGAAGGMRSDTVRIINYGPGRMDDAIWITGPTGMIGGFRTGILFSQCNADFGIDMEGVTFGVAAIRINQDEKIVLSLNNDPDHTIHERIYGGGDGIRLMTSPGGRSLFATDNANSTLVVSHPALGEVAFLDGTNTTWLIQNQVGVTFQKQACSKRNIPAWAPTVTLDFSLGAVQEVTLAGATTLVFSNVLDGAEYAIHLVQDAIGGRTVAWPSDAKFPGPSNLPPALSSQPNKRDIFKAVSDGSHVYIYAWALGF